MRHFFAKIICVLTAISLFDGHIAIMQSVAWVNMLSDRIPEQGLEEAIDTTFSGEFPCDQCLAIAEVKQKERDEPRPVEEIEKLSKLVMAPSEVSRCRIFPPHSQRNKFYRLAEQMPNSWCSLLDTPPPELG